jgi:hypothetical protein
MSDSELRDGHVILDHGQRIADSIYCATELITNNISASQPGRHYREKFAPIWGLVLGVLGTPKKGNLGTLGP